LSASEIVTETLRGRIINGSIEPGQRLTEERLSQELEVSRGPVREALRRLAEEGLIVLVPNKGATVRLVTRRWLTDLFAVREVFEGFAARMAAENLSEAVDRKWFAQQVQEWSSRGLGEDTLAFFEANLRFHQGLLNRCGNSRLTDFMPKLRTPIPAHLTKFLAQHNEERRRLSARDHVQIAEAILARDSVGAETLMRYHVRRTAMLLDKIPDDAFDSEPPRISGASQ
jgi:DNA-binding GntR family transcriptional regulator